MSIRVVVSNLSSSVSSLTNAAALACTSISNGAEELSERFDRYVKESRCFRIADEDNRNRELSLSILKSFTDSEKRVQKFLNKNQSVKIGNLSINDAYVQTLAKVEKLMK